MAAKKRSEKLFIYKLSLFTFYLPVLNLNFECAALRMDASEAKTIDICDIERKQIFLMNGGKKSIQLKLRCTLYEVMTSDFMISLAL